MARLPTVVDLGPRPSSRSPRGVVGVRAGIAEGAEARGFAEVARDSSRLATGFAKLARAEALEKEKLAREDARREALVLDTEYAEGVRALQLGDGTDQNPGFLNLQGQAAIDGREAHIAALENLHKRTLAKPSNDLVRDRVTRTFNNRLNSALGSSATHFGGQRRVANATAFKAHQGALADDAIVQGAAGNTDGLLETANKAGVAAAANALEIGVDPELAAEAAVTGILTSEIQRRALVSPGSARSFFNEHKGDIDGRQHNRIEATIQNAEARAIRLQGKAKARVASEIREIKVITGNGLNPGAERFARLRDEINMLGDPVLARDLAEAQQSQVLQEKLRVQTPADLQNIVNSERTRLAGKSATIAESERLGMSERLLTTMRTETARDPLAWANRVGLFEVEPVTFAGADAVSTMKNRVADARAVAAHYGVAPRFLMDEEATQLKATMSDLEPDEQLSMVATIANGFGRDAPKVLGEFSKSAPVLAHAGGLALQSTAHVGVARDILIGVGALADNKDLLPGALDQSDWTDDVLGAAVGELPETRAAIIESAKALYARGALQRGLTSANPNQDLWKASLQAVAGGIVDRDGERWGGVGEWNGSKVLIPTDMRADQFEPRIESLNDADLVRLSVGGEPPRDIKGRVLRADQLDDIWLVSAGVGRYLVSSTDPTSGPPMFFQGSGDEGLYILDLDLVAGDDTADGVPEIAPPPLPTSDDFSGAAP